MSVNPPWSLSVAYLNHARNIYSCWKMYCVFSIVVLNHSTHDLNDLCHDSILFLFHITILSCQHGLSNTKLRFYSFFIQQYMNVITKGSIWGCCLDVITKGSGWGCCLSFAYFFPNFSLVLLIKVLLIKKKRVAPEALSVTR